MAHIPFEKLKGFMHDVLVAAGMPAADAVTVTDIFVRATLRGTRHHDVNDLPRFIKRLIDGDFKVAATIRPVAKFAALESYDGDNGCGEVGCSFIMDRAIRLASEHGIGLCTIRNSNHFLAAAPYTEMAAEHNCIGIIYTKTKPSMSNPQGTAKVVGASPMGFAVSSNREYPIMFDACMAYLSNGAINDKIKRGERIPAHWGADANSLPTTDPAAIKNGGHRLPIGGHKGFGLAILCEVLTGVLSEGQILDLPNDDRQGTFSHTAIAIKSDGLMSLAQFHDRTTKMLDRMEARDPSVHIPGQGSYRSKAKVLESGVVEVTEETVAGLNHWARELGIDSL